MIKRVFLRMVEWCARWNGFVAFLLRLGDRWMIAPRSLRISGAAVPLLAKQRHAHLVILAAHRVNEARDPFIGGIDPAHFRVQLETLVRHYRLYELSEAVTRLQDETLPPNALVLTFDDGYRDNYEYAFPILKQLGLPATIFLTTGPLSDPAAQWLWHDRVFDAFRRTLVSSVVIDHRRYPLTTLSEREQALFAYRQYLRKFDGREWGEQIAVLRKQLDMEENAVGPGFEKLTWEQVREMAKCGIGFGAHTVSHPILTCVSREEGAREILESRAAIESQLHAPVDCFAYPNGGAADFDQETKDMVRRAGFLCAVSTLHGVNSRVSDRFALRRLRFPCHSPLMSSLRLAWQKMSYAAAARAVPAGFVS